MSEEKAKANTRRSAFAPTPELPAATTPLTVERGSTGSRTFTLPKISPNVAAKLDSERERRDLSSNRSPQTTKALE